MTLSINDTIDYSLVKLNCESQQKWYSKIYNNLFYFNSLYEHGGYFHTLAIYIYNL